MDKRIKNPGVGRGNGRRSTAGMSGDDIISDDGAGGEGEGGEAKVVKKKRKRGRPNKGTLPPANSGNLVGLNAGSAGGEEQQYKEDMWDGMSDDGEEAFLKKQLNNRGRKRGKAEPLALKVSKQAKAFVVTAPVEEPAFDEYEESDPFSAGHNE